MVIEASTVAFLVAAAMMLLASPVIWAFLNVPHARLATRPRRVQVSGAGRYTAYGWLR